MFLNMSNLKGLVFDLDSIDSFQELEWNLIPDEIEVFVISKSDSNLISLVTEKNSRVKILQGLGLYTIDKFKNIKSIQKIKEVLQLPVHQFAIITGNRDVVIELQRLPLNVIEFNSNDYKYETDDYRNLPDYRITNIDEIIDIISNKNLGYFSEFGLGKSLEIKENSYGMMVPRELKTPKNNTVKVIGAGRYFPSKDARSYTHLLSRRITWNKMQTKSQYKFFISKYKALMEFTNENVGMVDAICYIPKRPSDPEYDRFKEIANSLCQQYNKSNISSNFYCTRDYPKQKNLNADSRIENVKNAFSFSGNESLVNGKHIVIIDDVLVTGATTLEFADMLYAHGARTVTINVLALNQLGNTERAEFGSIRCKCSAEMVFRLNGTDGVTCFFGCCRFFDGDSRNHGVYNLTQGLSKFYADNERIIDEYEDNHDSYLF